jgi:hypothetical protein
MSVCLCNKPDGLGQDMEDGVCRKEVAGMLSECCLCLV